MTEEEAEKKAEEAVELELIKRDQMEAYAKHLYETHKNHVKSLK